jgi:hypothetical protein
MSAERDELLRLVRDLPEDQAAPAFAEADDLREGFAR